MPKGIKGFQKGHKTSKKTRQKISQALKRPYYYFCDYCGKKSVTKPSHYKKKKRHFCSMKCYSKFRSELLPKEEQNRYGKGEPIEVKIKKLQCRSDFNHYLRDKKIKRKPCVICGSPKSEGHHEDYDKPLKVIWLCNKHHRLRHRKDYADNPELLEQKL